MAIRSTAKFAEVRVTGFLARKRSPEILRAIEDGMLDSARRAIPHIQRFTPVFRGNLRANYQIQVRQAPKRVLITNPLGYLGVMEAGRRPGRRQPPPGPLQAWVAEKLGITGSRVKSVAFLIARKIGRFGIKVPLKVSGLGAMFRRTLQVLRPEFFAAPIAQRIAVLR